MKQPKIRDGTWEESGVYRYRFMHKGRRYFAADPLWKNRTEAKAARDKHRTAVREGRAGEADAFTNFAAFVRDTFLPWAETNKSSGTHQSYSWRSVDLIESFGKLDLREISTFGVEKFKREQLKRITQLGQPQTPASVNRYLRLLGSIFTRAEKLSLLRADERPKIEILKENGARIRYLTVAEESALRQAAQKRFPYLADMICVACATGLRRNELFSLKKCDIDLGLNVLHVMHGKGGKSRSVPLHAQGEARAILSARVRQGEGEYLFPSPHGGGKLQQVYDSLESSCAAVGLEDVTLHTFRHTFCTRLAAAGVDVRTIKELAGHSSIATTLRYMHLVESNVHAAIAKLTQYQDCHEITTDNVMQFDRKAG
jgi:integrase